MAAIKTLNRAPHQQQPATATTKNNLLTDEQFPLKNRILHLSLEVREELLLAVLLDKHSNQYIAWASIPFNEDEISRHEILNSELASVSVVFTPNNFLLVPALYFKKEALTGYLDSQLLTKPGETPCFDYIKNLDSYNLYTVNNALAIFRKKYPNALFRHHASLFLEYILLENKNSDEDRVHACIFTNGSQGTGYMDIAVLQSGKLILSNRFCFENSSDFIYYLLWLYEQTGMNAEKVPCMFYGDIEKTSEMFTLTSKYIKNVKLWGVNESAETKRSPLSALLLSHKYHSLFSQCLCI